MVCCYWGILRSDLVQEELLRTDSDVLGERTVDERERVIFYTRKLELENKEFEGKEKL